MIRPLNQKDFINFIDFCSTRDKFSDFYITKDNKRLFLNERIVAEQVFKNCIKHNDKSFIFEENGIIKGVMLIVGYSDKSPRKYIKLFAHEDKILEALIKNLAWSVDTDLYLKIRKNNPILKILQKSYDGKINYRYFFIPLGDRGSNIERVLLLYKPNGRIKALKSVNKDKDEEI